MSALIILCVCLCVCTANSLPRRHTARSGVCHHCQGAAGVQRRLLLPRASGEASPHPSEENVKLYEIMTASCNKPQQRVIVLLIRVHRVVHFFHI